MKQLEVEKKEKERIKREELAKQEEERMERDKRIKEEKEELKKNKLLNKINKSKESFREDLKNKTYTKENIIFDKKPKQIPLETNKKFIHKIKKSIYSSPKNSSDNFSSSKNFYQRKESQESNSKLSSSSGNDKIYKSLRFSRVKNVLTENRLGLRPRHEDINLQYVKSNDIIIKTEINEKKEKYEETKKEEENIEEIKKVKRKSALYLNKNKKKIKEKIKAEEEFNIKEEIQNIDKKDSEHYSTEVNNIKEEENIYKNIKKEKKNIYSTKKGLFKKNLQIETEEDNIELTETNDKNIKNLLSESELNNKKKPLLQSESNISDIFSSERILPLKIKIFKCIIYRNTEPTLNEEKIREIFHKKNKSLGIEKSLIIKLPEDFNEAIDKKEKGKIKEEKIIKRRRYMSKFMRGSKSTSNL